MPQRRGAAEIDNRFELRVSASRRPGRHTHRAILIALLAVSSLAAQTPSRIVLYEGARLIPGDGGAAIESSALLVENDTITAVGRAGEVEAPAGAARVNLAGRTVMPTLVNAHGHPGFQKGLAYSADNYTRENILDDLYRAAYFGVGAVMSQGIERGDAAIQVRDEQNAGRLGGALLRVAGRGIGAPNAGPGNPAYTGIAYEVTSAAEGVRSVREQAARNVDAIKIWVDDRNGRAPRMPAPVFRAIIAEAHAQGLRMAAHVYYHVDAVALVDAGVDSFAHLVRDRVMADELVAEIVRRNVYVMGNLSSSHRGTYLDVPPWLQDGDPMLRLLRDTVAPEVIERMRDSFTKRDPAAAARARERYAVLGRSLAKLNAAGARLILGADTGIEDHLFGLAAHRELEEMVKAGMSPAQAIAAATSRAAEYLALEQLGSLRPGKLATFIVLEANPLDDITNTRRITDVFFRGQRLDREQLRKRLLPASPRRGE